MCRQDYKQTEFNLSQNALLKHSSNGPSSALRQDLTSPSLRFSLTTLPASSNDPDRLPNSTAIPATIFTRNHNSHNIHCSLVARMH
jgi:hypothetical protein